LLDAYEFKALLAAVFVGDRMADAGRQRSVRCGTPR
jgi:hypothetical protein